jgi:predicted Zn-dependent peptidase
MWISMDGLSDNFESSLTLFEEVLNDPKLSDVALKNAVEDVLKKREDAKSDKRLILQAGLVAYAKYGPVNPFTYILSETELKKLSTEDVVKEIKGLNRLKHRILFYGPQDADIIKQQLSAKHVTVTELKDVPAEFDFKIQPYGGTVYVADYPMKQVEIVMLSEGNLYDRNLLPVIQLYNDYFGGSMSGVVFQDLRESKALAYSAYSNYMKPRNPKKKYENLSYIGSQADKLADAMKGMNDLLNALPKATASFEAAKEQVIQEIQSQRITKSEVLFAYEDARIFGNQTDVRKNIYEKVSVMTFEDVKKFHDT